MSDDSDDIENYVGVGDAIPQFTIHEDDGSTFDSSTLHGKKTALLFFNTGCSDCERELPVIEKAWRVLKDDPDVVFVTIARGQTVQDTETYWQEHQLTLPRFHDPKRAVFQLFANNYVPRLYLIDGEGRVQWMSIEKFNLTDMQLIEKIRMLDKGV